jgi:poly(hydroxyalkanoate) depolymerase family esterase
MLSYCPDRLVSGAPLVVVLHGCGQFGAAFASSGGWLSLADRCGFAVLAPEQTAENNPNRCFNWFQADDVARGRGEAASIAAMIDHLVGQRALDPRRVFIVGLSAGGAMAAAMLAAYPERFAGGAVIAGLPYGSASSLAQAIQVMRVGGGPAGSHPRALPPLSIWHGDADYVVNPVNARDLARQWTTANGLSATPDETIESPGLTRSVWRAAHGPKIAVELNLVYGLGHGVPLATREPGGVGAAAPFMLEAGVSSTRRIAAFWGLHDAGVPASESAPKGTAVGRGPGRLGDQVMKTVSAHAPAAVTEIIAKALTAAGLMK